MNCRYIYANFRYCFQLLFKYRVNIVFSFFSELAIPIIINILFITGLNKMGSHAKSFMDIVEYVIMANVILTISMSKIEETIAHDIRNSFLIYRLTEPTLPCMFYVTSDLANKTFRVLFFFLPAAIPVALFRGIDVASVFMTLLFLLIAIMIGYSISFIIGCLSFWLTEIWGISSIKMLMIAVVSGSVFPLTILPSQIQTIILYTPFPFMSFIPTAMLMGEMHDKVLELAIVGSCWCIIFLLSAVFVWKVGKGKYESFGV